MSKKNQMAESPVNQFSGPEALSEKDIDKMVADVMCTEKTLRGMTDDYEIFDTMEDFDLEMEDSPGGAFYFLEDVFKAVYGREVAFKTPYAYLRWFWPASYFLPFNEGAFQEYLDHYLTEHYKELFLMSRDPEWIEAFFKISDAYGFRRELMREPLDDLLVRYFSSMIFCMGEREICRFLNYESDGPIEKEDCERFAKEGRLALSRYALYTSQYYRPDEWRKITDADIKEAYASENLDRMDVFDDIAFEVLNCGVYANPYMPVEERISLMNKISSKWIWERDQKNRPYYFDKPKFQTFAKYEFERELVQNTRCADLINQIDVALENTRAVFEAIENQNDKK